MTKLMADYEWSNPDLYVNKKCVVPLKLNSKPTPSGREFNVTSVPLHWAYNPVHTVMVNSSSNILEKGTDSGYAKNKKLKHF